MIKYERNDTKSIAGKLIRTIGTIIFDTDVYPE